MSSGSAPVTTTLISMENLEKLCPGPYAKFWIMMKTHDIDERWAFEEFLSQNDDCPPQPTTEELAMMTELWEAWEELQEDFKKVTRVATGQHLDLWTGYYDQDNGDIYDEMLDGPFFCVDGVYVKSKAAEALGSILEDVQYTVYG